jgi:hypothetical protein
MAKYYPTEDTFLNASRGLIQGGEVVNIFGYQIAVDTTFRVLWEFASTNLVFPSSAIPLTITSASGSDDGKSLLIKGLDANWNVLTETVTLVGGGDVVTDNSFLRVNDVILTSGIENIGLITVQNAGKTEKYAGIRALDGRNQASHFSVPADHCYYLYRIDAFSSDSTSAKPGLFKNVSINNANGGQEYNVARTTFLGNMNIQRRFPFKYSEKTDIQFQLRTQTGTHEMNVFGEGLLLREPISTN